MWRPRNRFIVPLIHIAVWLCLFLYPFIFHYLRFSDTSAVFRISAQLSLVAAFFYFNLHILVPKLVGKRRFFLYFVIVALIITGVGYGAGYIQQFFNPEFTQKHESFTVAQNTAIITSFFAWVISSGMKITSEWFKSERMKKNIEHEKLQAEILFLKNQVNPHFLFNALNNIYSMQQLKSPKSGEAILKLSDLMRYTLYETSSATVPLENEITYLRNYVELQKLGIREDVNISFEVVGDPTGLQVEPLLLIPLVENAFKHGISYLGKEPINIRLTIEDSSIQLRVENAINTVAGNKHTTGIGLTNLRKRLSLLYPDSYHFEINDRDHKFIATLRINLKK